jgi:hypothetical protein
MTKAGVRLADIGEQFTWLDLRDFVGNLPPSPDSAVYRAQYPKSWWWTPEFDFLAATLNALQWANWQRGSGKGEKPKPVKRPKEQPKNGPISAEELQARKKSMRSRRTSGD